ncbi:protein involved in polysaccharide export, contains SLBB domain of the beta-grasp fold [Prosthecobacter debontii]|uniref:Protein involved in polysaccharide export, contains SLBB domain of the beta-grasp fold n=1 Tax=Prosthecobacter debontii TaxID=48467 RepID=A0A1T4WXE0_9BACT|nr:polysaccharide biosynthesis/export family protein [Prosthecobacter debontii]SKA81807.1 protein involved in polysaccharide export, contains SLBB domain of the beta-grasp fold [Prosthecobacter debontii]
MFYFRFLIEARLGSAALILTFLVQCTSRVENPTLPEPLAVPVQTQAPAAPKNAFVVGDQLELFVKEDSTLNGSYLVREGGYIVIPRAGRILVQGMTREEAEPKVREFLKKTQLKEASVIVERTSGAQGVNAGALGGASPQSANRILVYLTGSVPRSGAHQIVAPTARAMGVYEALLITGGLGKFAQLDKVEVFRTDSSGKRKKAVIDLRPIIKGEQDDPPIAEGDIINVPEKVFGF